MSSTSATPASGVYARAPLVVDDGIPVFSARDGYTDNYEQISNDHLSHLDQTGRNQFMDERMWREAEEATVALISSRLAAGGRILDIGVGLGRLLSRFPEAARNGMDISMPYLKRARTSGIEVCYSKVEDMPFRDGAFDVVVCTDVLEHVFDLNLACREALRVVKPDGWFIVRVPFREDLSVYLAKDFPYEFAHLRNFDEHGLRLFFERIMGCTIDAFSQCGYYPWTRRWRGNPGLFAWLMTKPMLVIRRFLPGVYRTLVPRFYLPTEINVVVRKPAVPQPPC